MGTQLVMCIIQDEDEDRLREAFIAGGHAFTKIGSTGGFLRKGNTTLIAVTEEPKVGALLDLITSTCHRRTHLVNPYLFEPEGFMVEPVEVEVGGAVVFVLDVNNTLRV